MNKNLIITIIVAIVFAAGGFFGGMKYQQSKRGTQFAQFANGQGARLSQGARGNGNGGGNFRPVTGQIISFDSGSITVKMTDGSSKIVIINDKTVVNQTSGASISDLKTGQEVAVFGTNNSDGSVTAQNVQLNPQQFRGSTTPSGNPNP